MDHFSESELQERLTPDEYHVLREAGTEKPFENEYWDYHGDGIFRCKVCGNKLFKATDKFESGTGWPSFDQPYSEDSVEYREDNSIWGRRVEVVCAKCESHLGHVFEDGPTETTGKRYCMNSICMDLEEE